MKNRYRIGKISAAVESLVGGSRRVPISPRLARDLDVLQPADLMAAGDRYAGKITIDQAVELVAQCKAVAADVRAGKYDDLVDAIRAIPFAARKCLKVKWKALLAEQRR